MHTVIKNTLKFRNLLHVSVKVIHVPQNVRKDTAPKSCKILDIFVHVCCGAGII